MGLCERRERNPESLDVIDMVRHNLQGTPLEMDQATLAWPRAQEARHMGQVGLCPRRLELADGGFDDRAFEEIWVHAGEEPRRIRERKVAKVG